MFYLYVLRCKDGSLYTGYTNNIEERLKRHNNGKASKYTRSRLPVKLIASWKFFSKPEAMRAEIQFKRLTRQEKLAAVRSNSRG